jgi:TIR domain
MDCFISYSKFDSEVAKRLKARLMARGVAVFLAEDTDSNPPGVDWPSNTKASARRCEIMVLLDSKASRKSAFVQQEAGMAIASGSLLIPMTLDGDSVELPGWLGGIQAVTVGGGTSLEDAISIVVDNVCNRLGASWFSLPPDLQRPPTVGALVLRTILLDQFSSPEERIGAWSRQYDRYLAIYYGEDKVRSGVSLGVSLTLTGMIIERLRKILSSLPTSTVVFVQDSLRRAEGFVLRSRSPQEGGFGRLSSDLLVRGTHRLALDLRHTCWAIRSLLAIDRDRHFEEINQALGWLIPRIQNRSESDRLCWTSAPLLALMDDTRLAEAKQWLAACEVLREGVQRDLEDSFDAELGSWVKGEKDPNLVRIDNALYVMYCLMNCRGLSANMKLQWEISVRRLVAGLWFSDIRGGARGLPLFHQDQPDVGPTAQLLEILTNADIVETSSLKKVSKELSNFIVSRFAERLTMHETFPWHLCAALTVPDLSAEKIV